MPGFPLSSSRVDALVARTWYSSARAAAELGYMPVVPIEESLRRLASEWRA